ncbi:PilZ domain-containing protein [Sphingomonas sp. ID1715]|uniref:PilZ domain-containing protein n=1 Tax=Sphingomonas sp. ID1715 TaxID=1656898 RepID=UPI001489C0AA|nr:PilZ domain-containing protein [Sphingomonas sp. ID1715]NNM76315.1 PilZ domain-containing protein [Sphingomonas sp. ID1715]
MQHDPETNTDSASDRASERRAFFLTTTLFGLDQGSVGARVRNLSAGGMMIELAEEPEPEIVRGQRLTAELRNIGRVKGEIAWCEGRRFGIRFDREIDPEAARKPVSNGASTPDFIKPVLVPGRALKYVEGLGRR